MEVLLRARIDLPAARRRQARARLADLLVGSGRAEETAALAASWLAADQDSESLRAATDALLRRGEVDAALVLSDVCLDIDPDAGHVVIGSFAKAGYGASARLLIAEWLEGRPVIGPSDQAALLAYASQLNDYSIPLALLRGGGPGAFGPDFILGVIRGVYRRFGLAGVDGLLKYARPRVLAEDPLFAAELAMALGQHRTAASYLLLASARVDLDAGHRARLAELTGQLRPPALRLDIARRLLAQSNT
jgi:hypothetical protein